MDLLLTARHFELSPRLREYVEKRARRLERYDGRLGRVEVTLVDEKRVKRVEASASVRGDVDVHARAEDADFRTALNRALRKLRRQLKRRHDRRLRHHAPRLGRDIPARPSSEAQPGTG